MAITRQFMAHRCMEKESVSKTHPERKKRVNYVYESSRKVWMGKGEDQETGKKELIEWCKLLEGELGDKSYFGIETLGFVDIALVPFYNWFIFFKTFADFSFEAECPKLVSWGKRCFEKECVSKSLPNPDQIYAAYLEFQKRMQM
ncbi:putative glutathione S-transferase parA [Camellia lanceoleosa]|uniref:Glutathione S-transferase parA n=1 Tax=Camellia lanceoleosa TaxID=1840588 RepID=A0ACC0H105_9ERIC|nr:putative glutathione S-transferase parA [Camellia lanceoleosa]